jgi:hypothetical protein
MYDLEMKELLQLTEFVPRVRQPAPYPIDQSCS